MSTLEAVRTTQEVANRMNELFKENKWAEVQEELFAENAVSIEPPHSQGLQTVEGLAAISFLSPWALMQLIKEWEGKKWKRSQCTK